MLTSLQQSSKTTAKSDHYGQNSGKQCNDQYSVILLVSQEKKQEKKTSVLKKSVVYKKQAAKNCPSYFRKKSAL